MNDLIVKKKKKYSLRKKYCIALKFQYTWMCGLLVINELRVILDFKRNEM